MVLGFLLYEAVDVVYNVGRVGWNGVAGAYRWYYGIEEEPDRESGHSLTDAEVAAIVDRLAKLEALVATAVGLLAAIPAVMAYNWLSGRLIQLQNHLDDFATDYLNILRRHFFS